MGARLPCSRGRRPGPASWPAATPLRRNPAAASGRSSCARPGRRRAPAGASPLRGGRQQRRIPHRFPVQHGRSPAPCRRWSRTAAGAIAELPVGWEVAAPAALPLEALLAASGRPGGRSATFAAACRRPVAFALSGRPLLAIWLASIQLERRPPFLAPRLASDRPRRLAGLRAAHPPRRTRRRRRGGTRRRRAPGHRPRRAATTASSGGAAWPPAAPRWPRCRPAAA